MYSLQSRVYCTCGGLACLTVDESADSYEVAVRVEGELIVSGITNVMRVSPFKWKVMNNTCFFSERSELFPFYSGHPSPGR